MEKLLFFGLTDAEFQKIKPVASRLKLHCEQSFSVSMHHNTLSAQSHPSAVPAASPPRHICCPRQPHGCFRRRCPAGAPLPAACGIPGWQHSGQRLRDRLPPCRVPAARRMDKLLFELRRTTPIDYKAAILTHKRRMDDSGVFSWKCTRKTPLTPQNRWDCRNLL